MTLELFANSVVVWEDWVSKTAPAGNRGLAHPKPLSLSEGRTAMVPPRPAPTTGTPEKGTVR